MNINHLVNTILFEDSHRKYDRPYNANEIKRNYGLPLYNKLSQDPAHKWRMETGLELIHKEPSYEEQLRIFKNWQLMSNEQKRISDEKSFELFGMSNADHHSILMKEWNKNKILYRSGPTQNIKIFKPQKNITQNSWIKHDLNKIYATDDPSFAAGFCFVWADQEGFSFGSNNRYSGPWVLKVPRKYQNRLDNPCSMYAIDGSNFTKVKGDIPEYISTQSAKVFNEVKFNTCWDCLKKYGVVVKV